MSGEYAEIMKVCIGALWTVLLALGGYVLRANCGKIDRLVDKIEELKESAEALTTLMKPSILRDLEQISSVDV